MQKKIKKIVSNLVNDAKSYARPHKKFFVGKTRGLVNSTLRQLPISSYIYEPVDIQWQRILRKSEKLLDRVPKDGPKVLFATSHGFGEMSLLLESVYAMALRLRGANPIFFECDKALPACEFNRFGNGNPDPGAFGANFTARTLLDVCRKCSGNLSNAFDSLPLPKISFTQYKKRGDLQRAIQTIENLSFKEYRDFTHQGINVGEHAFASVMRNTHRGTFEETPEMKWLFERYLVATVFITDLFERVLEDICPDVLVAVHGVYVTHGTICEIARKKGIHVVVHGTPFRLNTVWLSHNDTYHRTLVTEPNTNWENLELTPEREKVIDAYIAEKRFGARDYVAYHKDSINDHESIAKTLGLSDGRPVVSLFSNVIWDAQLFFKYNAFGNILEWIFETIEFFQKETSMQLVIRIHPAEARGQLPTNQPLLPEIERKFPALPENIKIVKSESKVSSYSLAEMSHAALVYGARMGGEIAILGTPLIIAGESINRRKGFSYDVESRDEYFELLKKIPTFSRNSPEIIERAKKYAYHYYFRIMMEFPWVRVKENMHLSQPELTFETLESLEVGRSEALDVICRGIMDQTSPLYLRN